MERSATAVWEGGLKTGSGNITTDSRAVARMQYGFRSRFENEAGTNPEELIAAAHAGCFSMQLSGILEQGKFIAEKIETRAKVTLEQRPEGALITGVHLHVKAAVPGIDTTAFEEAAHQAKETCPVSRLLDVPIKLDIALDNRGGEKRIAG